MAAWFCANSPQSVTYHLILWSKGAQHFSHQQQLRSEVAALLAGHPIPSPLSVSRAERPPAPALPVPGEAVLKKIDLSPGPESAAAFPSAAALCFATANEHARPRGRAKPLLLPPRAA
jgi:hypothetical protein